MSVLQIGTLTFFNFQLALIDSHYRPPIGGCGVEGGGEGEGCTARLGVDLEREGIVVGGIEPRIESDCPAVIGLHGCEVGEITYRGVENHKTIGRGKTLIYW